MELVKNQIYSIGLTIKDSRINSFAGKTPTDSNFFKFFNCEKNLENFEDNCTSYEMG